MMSKTVTIVDGECEQNICNMLKREGYDFGKVHKNKL